MTWQQLLAILKTNVQAGQVTTYGNLSQTAFGRRNGGQAIRAMLHAAVTTDFGNRVWTNRVVKFDGAIPDVNGQLDQLIREHVPIMPGRLVDFDRCPPVDCNDLAIPNEPEQQEPPEPPAAPQIPEYVISEWQSLHFSDYSQGQTYTWIGFDSAWTNHNKGAMSWMTGNQFGLSLKGVIPANFEDCRRKVESFNSGMQLLMIDQPTIVRNTNGRRPVEMAIAHEVGRAGGGIQPANLNRENMFGDAAPIWPFLDQITELGFVESPEKAKNAGGGKYYLETYPALGNLGLFGYEKCPKYNPTRNTFSLRDWRALCHGVEQFGDILNIEGLPGQAVLMQELDYPKKEDQDKLDAILCMLFGYVWWRSGLKHSTIIGTIETGYTVVPCFKKGLRRQLATDASQHNVDIDTYFHSISVTPSKQKIDNHEAEETSGRGFISWIAKYFHRWLA